MSKPSASLGYMTPEQEIARLAKLVSAAKALLSLQVGLAVGASRVRNALSWLGATYEQKHPVFKDFIDNIPRDIPLGGARLLWNPCRHARDRWPPCPGRGKISHCLTQRVRKDN